VRVAGEALLVETDDASLSLDLRVAAAVMRALGYRDDPTSPVSDTLSATRYSLG